MSRMKLQEMTIFQLPWDSSVKRYEAINNDGIPPAHAQYVALIHFEGSQSTPKKHKGSCNSSFYSIFFTVQFILFKESPENWQFLFYGLWTKSIKFPLDHITMIDNSWPVLLFMVSSITVPNLNSSSQNAVSCLFFLRQYALLYGLGQNSVRTLKLEIPLKLKLF